MSHLGSIPPCLDSADAIGVSREKYTVHLALTLLPDPVSPFGCNSQVLERSLWLKR